MKMLLIIGVVVLIISAISIICILDIEQTTQYSGLLEEYDYYTNVQISITHRKYQKLINKMNGKIKIYESNTFKYEYNFSGSVFDFGNYYAAPLYRLDKYGLASHGYLLFDKNLKNIVVETTKEKIVSADPTFLDIIS